MYKKSHFSQITIKFLFFTGFVLFIFAGCSSTSLEKVDLKSIKEKTLEKKEKLEKLKEKLKKIKK